jgi:2-methylcitrate dehydratase
MRCWWTSSITRDARIDSPLAFQTAHHCLLDTLGCGLEALSFPACSKLLGPLVPGISVVNGRACRVRTTCWTRCRPPSTWARWCAGWISTTPGWPPNGATRRTISAASCRLRLAGAQRAGPASPAPTLHDVLLAMIKAHEIQGVLALQNSFNRVGLDHVVLVKVATTAVVAQLLGLDRERMLNALSLAWVDGQALRTYRHAPNTGSRKSWAAGDATSRGVRLALMAASGEMGYPSVLSAPTWGFEAVSMQGRR